MLLINLLLKWYYFDSRWLMMKRMKGCTKIGQHEYRTLFDVKHKSGTILRAAHYSLFHSLFPFSCTLSYLKIMNGKVEVLLQFLTVKGRMFLRASVCEIYTDSVRYIAHLSNWNWDVAHFAFQLQVRAPADLQLIPNTTSVLCTLGMPHEWSASFLNHFNSF